MTYKKQNEKANDPITASQERAVEIYARLVQGRGFKRADLEEEFNISTRTAQRDMDAIRNVCMNYSDKSDVPQDLIFDRKEKVYKLEPVSRSLLTKSEAFSVIKVLLESRGFNNEEMKKLVSRLIDCCVAPSEQTSFRNLVNREFTNYVGPRHGKNVIEDVWNLGQSVFNQNIVEIDYESKYKHKTTLKLMPIAVLFSEYYFYLLAYKKSASEDKVEPERRFPYVYRIDRIKYYKVFERKHFNLQDVTKIPEHEIRKRIHFMFGGPLKKVEFYCLNESLEAALDRLPSAIVKRQDEKRALVEAEVYGDGIDMWLKSQGDRVEVVK